MGRPKRPFNGLEDLVSLGDRWARRRSPTALGVRQRQRWDSSRGWQYPTPNGVFDPLTYMFILDTLIDINPDIELRAANMGEYMKVKYPQIGWDNITIGKVLADIEDVFEVVLGEDMGLLEGTNDYRGRLYNIHHFPDVISLYYAVRDELMVLVLHEMDMRRHNDKEHRLQRLQSPLNECPSVRGEFEAVG